MSEDVLDGKTGARLEFLLDRFDFVLVRALVKLYRAQPQMAAQHPVSNSPAASTALTTDALDRMILEALADLDEMEIVDDALARHGNDTDGTSSSLEEEAHSGTTLPAASNVASGSNSSAPGELEAAQHSDPVPATADVQYGVALAARFREAVRSASAEDLLGFIGGSAYVMSWLDGCASSNESTALPQRDGLRRVADQNRVVTQRDQRASAAARRSVEPSGNMPPPPAAAGASSSVSSLGATNTPGASGSGSPAAEPDSLPLRPVHGSRGTNALQQYRSPDEGSVWEEAHQLIDDLAPQYAANLAKAMEQQRLEATLPGLRHSMGRRSVPELKAALSQLRDSQSPAAGTKAEVIGQLVAGIARTLDSFGPPHTDLRIWDDSKLLEVAVVVQHCHGFPTFSLGSWFLLLDRGDGCIQRAPLVEGVLLMQGQRPFITVMPRETLKFLVPGAKVDDLLKSS